MGELQLITLRRSEYEVLVLLRQGKGLAEITRELGLARASVYTYVRNLAEKFEVRGALGVATKWATYDDRGFEVAAVETRGKPRRRGAGTAQVADSERDRFYPKTLHNT